MGRRVLSGRSDALTLIVGVQLLRRKVGVTDLRQWAIPVPSCESWRSRSLRWLLRLRGTPLRSGRSMDRRRLVGLRMDVLRNRGTALVGHAGCSLSILQ